MGRMGEKRAGRIRDIDGEKAIINPIIFPMN